MSRSRGRKFDVVKDEQLGIEVIMYVNSDKVFSAEFNGKTFQGTNPSTLEEQLRAEIKSTSSIEWLPVMEIGITPVKKTYAVYGKAGGAAFDIERYYVAKMLDGAYRKVSWEIAPEKRTLSIGGHSRWEHTISSQKQKRKNTWGPGTDNVEIVVPYTEEAWNQMLKLRAAFDQITLIMEKTLIDAVDAEHPALLNLGGFDSLIEKLEEIAAPFAVKEEAHQQRAAEEEEETV